MLITQQFFVAVVVAAAVPEWNDVVDVDAQADVVASITDALLALATIASPDAVAVLDALPASHALHCVWPGRRMAGQSIASAVQTWFQCLNFNGLTDGRISGIVFKKRS
jgi:hypothetical protein